ncbi:MAG: tRNA glutamyl-Q(34) synthetase GluQRS [Lysobacterales bacterium 69-70]|nr:tRNA glutamyl-Q(34) synthetase GluQRS [Xanthomonadaceae bacterium]ODU34781.1 MAG: tRNA glutamyl-Q(34) synthetase GluQRS [Xanthomonadaceae bacterium SCN 69-320]ODV19676.1 MAG: tRNA glutamyl-Q(34) synthetase GluQRS [Xanthomonadaceae bacterium SCN 69-25]OJY95035.1 MAG: tRNA glutamyl-Q(34) synthetase GluQRS [Xanthomonadales bacterium 69-70]
MNGRPAPAYRGRFAPSPTGALHFGSLVAAIGSWLRARSRSGSWIIRIEDLDPPREVAGAAQQQIETLAAFGLVSDEPILWQHQRHDAYAAALRQLVDAGHAFPCWCSRSDLQRSAGLHHSPCVAAPAQDRAPAWRLRVPDLTLGFDDRLLGRYEQPLATEVGDFVVRRVEGYYAYQLAVVVDDAAQGISEVVRGADLLDSTPRQILLQQRLGLPTPAYLHLPLALDAAGRKLSKQDQALPIDATDPLPALRAALEFLGLPIARLSHAASPPALLAAAVEVFDVAAIPHTASIVRMRHGSA